MWLADRLSAAIMLRGLLLPFHSRRQNCAMGLLADYYENYWGDADRRAATKVSFAYV